MNRIKFFLSLLLICVMAVTGICPVQAESDRGTGGTQENVKTVIYLNGQDGDDTRDGSTAENAVKTFEKAAELSGDTGVIAICGIVEIEKNTIWELPENVVIERAAGYKRPLIQVHKDAVLTLKGISMDGDASDIVGEGQAEFTEGGIRRIGNTLRVSCEDVPFGSEPKPVIEENLNGEEPVITYKAEKEEEYTSDIPKEPGRYTVRVTTPATEEYKKTSATCEFQILPEEGNIEQPSEGSEEPTGTPTATEEPTGTPTPTEEPTGTPTPTEEPAGTPTPTEEPADTPTPEPTEVPDKKDSAVTSVEKAIENLPTKIKSHEDVLKVVDVTKKYEKLSKEQQNKVNDRMSVKLQDAQNQSSVINQTCRGITVSGDIPWYVKFVVEDAEEKIQIETTGYDTILAPYEMFLWDLMKDEEYHLDGKVVSVTMPTPKSEKDYENLIVMHYLEDGSVEYIQPSYTDSVFTFETTSFSPFRIAGDHVLVGDSDKVYGSGSQSGSSSSDKGSNTSNGNKDNGNKYSNSVVKPVKTGDTTEIVPYVIGMLAAIAVIGGLASFMIRKKREENDQRINQKYEEK